MPVIARAAGIRIVIAARLPHRRIMRTASEAASVTDGDPAEGGDSTAVDSDGSARSREAKRELGVELLGHLEADDLSLSAAIDRIETVTTSPSLTREILDTAEKRGVIDRDDGRIRVRRGGSFVRFESQVVARDGDFECRRCGAGLSTGHFIQFETGELGAFGSDCIKKVVGRET